MKKILTILATILVIIFLMTLAPFVLWPLLFLAYFFVKTPDKVKLYALAFVYGITSDLVTGMQIGISSIVLLGFVLSLFLLSMRFRVDLKISAIVVVVFELLYLVLFNFL